MMGTSAARFRPWLDGPAMGSVLTEIPRSFQGSPNASACHNAHSSARFLRLGDPVLDDCAGQCEEQKTRQVVELREFAAEKTDGCGLGHCPGKAWARVPQRSDRRSPLECSYCGRRGRARDANTADIARYCRWR